MQSLPTPLEFDGSSYKDPFGRVFSHNDEILRQLSPEGYSVYDVLHKQPFFADLINRNLLVATEQIDGESVGLKGQNGGILRHRRVPVVSYPYEWCFEMLQTAALLTLEVLERCLQQGYILKDASSFNVLFEAGRPIFVDVASIRPYVEHEYWFGYGQFCRSFLYPLMLNSYFGMQFQEQIRTASAELSVEAMAKLTSPRRWFRPGVFKDVVLQNFFNKAYNDDDLLKKTDFKNLNIDCLAILKNVRRLQKLVSELRPATDKKWTEYESSNSYRDTDRALKRHFIAEVLQKQTTNRVIDLGCNSGEYSEIVAKICGLVVGIDSDSGAIARYFARSSRVPKMNPVLANLLDPSPALGWNLTERRSLFERVSGDFFLALALVHHLRISGNVPFPAIFNLFKKIAKRGIIEWVDRGDMRVVQLLQLKNEPYNDYNWQEFSQQLKQHFTVLRVLDLECGTRKLVYVEARA